MDNGFVKNLTAMLKREAAFRFMMSEINSCAYSDSQKSLTILSFPPLLSFPHPPVIPVPINREESTSLSS